MENESGLNEINSNKSLESSMNSTIESFKSQLSFKDEVFSENIKIIKKYTEDLKNYCSSNKFQNERVIGKTHCSNQIKCAVGL